MTDRISADHKDAARWRAFVRVTGNEVDRSTGPKKVLHVHIDCDGCIRSLGSGTIDYVGTLNAAMDEEIRMQDRYTDTTKIRPRMCKHDDGDCHADDPCDNCPTYPTKVADQDRESDLEITARAAFNKMHDVKEHGPWPWDAQDETTKQHWRNSVATKNSPAETPGWNREGIVQQNKEFDAVNALAEQWRRLSMTPIVDDDYPEVRHYYESAMRDLIDALRINRPEVFASGAKR